MAGVRRGWCQGRWLSGAGGRRPRPWHRSIAVSASERGYLLPLAGGGSLLLLVSCLSLQSLIWGRQLDARGAWQQRQADDLLGSAAQRLAVAFNRSHRCLLALPSSAWSADASLAAGCGDAADPADLLRLSLPGGVVRLAGWWPPAAADGASPSPGPFGWGELTLAQELPQRPVPVQRRYRLLLDGESWRVIGVQELDR